ncbi:MAG: tRNA (N6-isopentenyl adenosine(37)-C2)-methylthiotransferase MiaB [Deltaproteobacteria bacterium]|jgi:tRNA-2-methylthio-N6-dimethylallyladenosine synthase|nr:tRNA (N6-isopentenyl adenosine(37)-C2)-methylthiotransferase MiaB [Deltaproteobacteria bacterium]MBT6491463.1 tRNA (N6-isopentenyl adenosine(37)-C2)-methylthiotransferase MiaB [Deltaproteobacteria bacterium]
MTEKNEKGKVFLSTYGCQMNVLDSQLVQGQLEALGYGFVDQSDDADIVLLNTCSIRELSEHKVWSALGRLAIAKQKEKPDLVVGVLGCMAEREGKGISDRMKHVDIVCGPSNLDQIPLLVDNAVNNRGTQISLAGHTSRRSKTLQAAEDNLENLDLSRAFSPADAQSQAYVRITRGCNKFCAFCVVPFTRGPEVHRPVSHIIEEVKKLVGSGVKEVTLLGQTVNHYKYTENGTAYSFADLLRRVHDSNPDLPRLRFLTSYPRDFTDDALDAMAESPRICRYLHIPAQSGSNTMLKKMNRGYTVEQYLDLLDRARSRMPNIRLAGDMIVGFPNETEEDHQASIELLNKARYKSCFIFKYSPRPGTVSNKRLEDNIPDAVKKKRNVELLGIQAQISLELHQAYEGKTFDVLVEGESKLRAKPQAGEVQLGWEKLSTSDCRLVGRTQGDEIVIFDGKREQIGDIVRVRATGATNLTIQGELANPAKPTESRSEVSTASQLAI